MYESEKLFCCSSCASGHGQHTRRCRRHQRFLRNLARQTTTMCRIPGCNRASSRGYSMSTCCSLCSPTLAVDHTTRCNFQLHTSLLGGMTAVGGGAHGSSESVGSASAGGSADAQISDSTGNTGSTGAAVGLSTSSAAADEGHEAINVLVLDKLPLNPKPQTLD